VSWALRWESVGSSLKVAAVIGGAGEWPGDGAKMPTQIWGRVDPLCARVLALSSQMAYTPNNHAPARPPWPSRRDGELDDRAPFWRKLWSLSLTQKIKILKGCFEDESERLSNRSAIVGTWSILCWTNTRSWEMRDTKVKHAHNWERNHNRVNESNCQQSVKFNN